MCNAVTIDLIIGLPSIKFFNLLPVLKAHIDTMACCEICATTETTTERAPCDDAREEERQAPQRFPASHSGYTREMQALFEIEINAVTDNMATPTYSNEDELIQALQGLHMSEILGFEDDGADEEGPNDIDIQLMGNTANEDYTMGGSECLQSSTRDTDESVVLQILGHHFSDTGNKLWLVQLYDEDPPSS